MEKSKFERFIGKYNLGGACESVTLKSDGDTLSVRAISDDKNVLAEVSVKGIKFPEGEFGVYDTKKLRSILSVLDENLTVKTNTSNGKVTGIDLTDGDTKATFVLADQSVIPPVPDLKKIPPIDITITLDEKFVNTFVKASNALSEVETFVVMSEGEDKTASVVIGHSSNNTNRIYITATTKEVAKLQPTSFSAGYLREILSANKEAKDGILKISSKGLATAVFNVDGVSSYYLVQITA